MESKSSDLICWDIDLIQFKFFLFNLKPRKEGGCLIMRLNFTDSVACDQEGTNSSSGASV